MLVAMGSDPGARVAASVDELCLWCALSWVLIVLPSGCEGQRHEDGLDPAASSQAKGGAPVVHLQSACCWSLHLSSLVACCHSAVRR